jgi:hypothetical protein
MWAQNRSANGYALRLEGVAEVTKTAAVNARILWNGQPIAAPVAGGTAFLRQDGQWVTPSASAGVSSFNARSGAVTLTSTDVTTALGFTPASASGGVSSFNTRSGAVSLTRSDVINALGYTVFEIVASTDTVVNGTMMPGLVTMHVGTRDGVFGVHFYMGGTRMGTAPMV